MGDEWPDGKVDGFFQYPVEFLYSCVQGKDLKPQVLPEVAFSGRSNVGKSSLLNALCYRKTLARVSHTPGRTQSLNFFEVRKQLIFVDLPGYGYARVSQQKQKTWGGLVEDYLKKSNTLKRVFVLVDARHGFKPSDLTFMDYLCSLGQSFQVVLTKKDKVSGIELGALEDNLSEQLRQFPAALDEKIYVSARKKEGITQLRRAILEATL